MEVSLKTDNAEHNEAKSTADGFETWNPPAPGIGLNSVFFFYISSLSHKKKKETGVLLSILNLTDRSPPYQPAKRLRKTGLSSPWL